MSRDYWPSFSHGSNSSGPVIKLLKFFSIWNRIHGYFHACKRLFSVIDSVKLLGHWYCGSSSAVSFSKVFFYNLKREIHKISYTLFHDSNSIEPKIHRQNHLCVEVHGCDFFILKNHTDNTKSRSAVSLKPWSQTTLCH